MVVRNLLGSSADLIWSCMKNAFGFSHFGHGATTQPKRKASASPQSHGKKEEGEGWGLTVCGIYVLPAFFSAHDVVHLFALEMQPCGHLAHDGKLVRTRMARPLVVALVIELDDETVGTGWTEQHLVSSLLAECVATGWKLRVKAQSELMQRWSDGSGGDNQDRNGENFGGRLQSKTLKPAPAKRALLERKHRREDRKVSNRSESHSRAAGQAWLQRSVIGTPPGRPSPSWPVVGTGFGAHRLAWRPASLAWSAVHQGLPAAPGLLLGHRHPQSQAEGERMMRIRSNSEHGLAADRIWPALWPSFSLNAASVCIRTTATVRICDIPLSLGRRRKRRRGRYDHRALIPEARRKAEGEEEEEKKKVEKKRAVQAAAGWLLGSSVRMHGSQRSKSEPQLGEHGP